MQKAVAKGEVIISAEQRAKNNGLKLHASTSKTQRFHSFSDNENRYFDRLSEVF